MTQRYLGMIARTINTAQLKDGRERAELAEHFAEVLARTHLRFDRERFIRAATKGMVPDERRQRLPPGHPRLLRLARR
jgi:hypothetical protein